MAWYKLLTSIAFALLIASISIHLIRLIKFGKPTDYSKKAGNTAKSIRYSFTGAMSPSKKESAFLHLPTYTAGVIYHLGTFLSLALFFILFFNIHIANILGYIVAAFLAISAMCGLGILIKRFAVSKLRSLSNPDDYISNGLVTLVQALTAGVILNAQFEILYFIAISLLFLYFPLGKLKHAIYFFAARYQLGFFYGWRGVWPPQNNYTEKR
jgi:hypothetical protein